MTSTPSSHNYKNGQNPFVLATKRLIMVPTPTAISLPSYHALFASLHANELFCRTAFGDQLPAANWSKEKTHEVILNDVVRRWGLRGMGDLAVGLRASLENGHTEKGRSLRDSDGELRIFEGDDYNALVRSDEQTLDAITWVGYAGVRDATTTSMPAQTDEDSPLPPWQEMIELRYGLGLDYWGQGLAKEAAEAVMQWAVSERGARRFLAITEKENAQSKRVLNKMGFSLSGTNYWKEPSGVEWERVVEGSV
ncbi:GNAT domain-containing protein [Dactylonectria estremocensis]|uniref:GNAT domain-containing protein n=1 Tax=Dactylonectria estremocensis TaxID=1079267 RepID=A0A9P9FIC0_9HYPO|nr:GNAT domain-containing protein [Dactylonectria estremocensis]